MPSLVGPALISPAGHRCQLRQFVNTALTTGTGSSAAFVTVPQDERWIIYAVSGYPNSGNFQVNNIGLYYPGAANGIFLLDATTSTQTSMRVFHGGFPLDSGFQLYIYCASWTAQGYAGINLYYATLKVSSKP